MIGTLLGLVFVFVCTGVSSADKDADNVRIVTVGQIRKIDLKKKTFQFAIALDSGPIRGGFGGRGGRGGPRGGRGGRFPRYPGAGEIQVNPTIEVTVFTSERTILKSAGNAVDFSTLRVADQVSVTGIHKGGNTDLEAIEIDRLRADH
jgi:hypothetical protein